MERIIDRRSASTMRTIIAGVVAPLIVVSVIGYIGLHSNITKLTLIADQSEQRISALEKEHHAHLREYIDVQLMMTRQTTVLEQMLKEVQEIKVSYQELWMKVGR